MGGGESALKARSGMWPSVAGKGESLRGLEESQYSHLGMLWR